MGHTRSPKGPKYHNYRVSMVSILGIVRMDFFGRYLVFGYLDP